ncbi:MULTISPECIES: alpha/beta hydrolase [Rhodanobacter]|uniref:alpha/beta hydrolase n=1 Tax=Rhodanobacter TaxID=75309 RepID=UPI0004080F92|nr:MULTISPECIES: dienelactone hydrolase family protein [Rhodanobacter]KZC19958.1 carboxylesterase [Rhodanobacter denitrificans]UJJ51217.1 alpha/beta hydrolase [Rhodanobacter denitrificans]UJM93965.1 dienelactone hydrolase family protein [Rhodanobacter denitrificans]UJM97494.1 dienelactone hydrolase family protein [Rhodanobacter denitrificans]UJN23091.1 dienelactone hydrolase family protein [Rhodanobacter denitrificans]
MTLPTVEHETGTSPRYSIIWLHGLGADGHDFAPIVPELVDPAWPALRFVFPHAPVRPVTINNGMSMRAWYDIIGFDARAPQDEAGIRASIAAVGTLIEREHARGVPSERIVLAGFSQGGAIALSAGLRHAEKLAGIIALSTYLPISATLAAERSAANAATPIFQGHGSADPVVALPRGTASRDALQALGYPVDWHTYPMAHAVCAEEIDDLRRWLGQRLA